LPATDESKPVTTYTPGARVMINLRVKQYNQQYRGLLMYAHSSVSNLTKVGDWDFVDRTTMFHSWCPKSVLHSGAELKPYLTQWAFTAPPKGTGTITFRRAPQDRRRQRGRVLLPQQARAHRGRHCVAPSQTWFRAAVMGQSCDEVCSANCGMTCDATQLATIDTADALETNIAPFINCAKPYLVRCGREGVTSSNDGLCYYHSAAACPVRQPERSPLRTAPSSPPWPTSASASARAPAAPRARSRRAPLCRPITDFAPHRHDHHRRADCRAPCRAHWRRIADHRRAG
jgi:hypothetical protein